MFRKKIDCSSKWAVNGKEEVRHFEPDSSPEAWKHYEVAYGDNAFGPCYRLGDQVFRTYKCGQYENNPKAKNNRLVSVYANKDKWAETPCEAGKVGELLYTAGLKLAGEVDFNFNSKHSSHFKAIIKTDGTTTNEATKAKALVTLKECEQMHHTLCNFSLMQVMGNMQGFKGVWCHDRLDRFLFWLAHYYEVANPAKGKHPIIVYAGSSNAGHLMTYLEDFDNIYDYCQKVYFIHNDNTEYPIGIKDKQNKPIMAEGLVSALIESGKHPINNAERVIAYMNLAMAFWCMKEHKFIGIYSKRYASLHESLFPNGGERYTKEELRMHFEKDGVAPDDFEFVLELFEKNDWISEAGNGLYTR